MGKKLILRIGKGLLGFVVGFVIGYFWFIAMSNMDIIHINLLMFGGPSYGLVWVPITLLGSPLLGTILGVYGWRVRWWWVTWVVIIAALSIYAYLPIYQSAQAKAHQEEQWKDWRNQAEAEARRAFPFQVMEVGSSNFNEGRDCNNVLVMVMGRDQHSNVYRFMFFQYNGPSKKITSYLLDSQLGAKIQSNLPPDVKLHHMQPRLDNIGSVYIYTGENSEDAGNAYINECSLQLAGINLSTPQGTKSIKAK